MVGCWNLGLKMIPNDRRRSSLGPPVDFGQKIPKFQWKIHFFGKQNPKKSWKIMILRRIPIQTAGAHMLHPLELRQTGLATPDVATSGVARPVCRSSNGCNIWAPAVCIGILRKIMIFHDFLGFCFPKKWIFHWNFGIFWPKSTGGPSDDLRRSFGIIFSPKFQHPTIFVNHFHVFL